MKKRNIIGICLFIAGAVIFFWYLVEKDQKISEKTLVNSETISVSAQPHYYMKIQGSQIVIFNHDHSVYEYTDLEPEFLPEEVLQELYEGKQFESQEELYEFLETYTS